MLATPQVFNTDQGSQFTSRDFTSHLEQAGVAISMDGRGRVFDNIFSERLLRTVKYEEVYLNEYQDGRQAVDGLGRYFDFYNHRRLHQSLDYRTPAEVYFENRFSCLAFPQAKQLRNRYYVTPQFSPYREPKLVWTTGST